MATYLHNEIPGSPTTYWGDVDVTYISANSNRVDLVNTDGSYTFLFGSGFTFTGSGSSIVLTGGEIQAVGRSDAAFSILYEAINNVNFAATAFQAHIADANLTGVFQAMLSGDNIFTGFSGADTLKAFAGNDTLKGGLGDDIIQGGVGVDTAGFAGLSRQYAINGPNAVNGVEGVDQLVDVEILQFADGRMVYDQGDAAAIAYRMYDSAFGRAPDSLGENYWTFALKNGFSVVDMASAFAASEEFVGTYGALNQQEFVQQLYRNVLDREGEGAGVAYWTNLLNTNTLSRGQVLAGFSESTEHVQILAPAVSAGIWDVHETAASVARLYDATFDRLPDSGGLLYWTNLVDNGNSFSAVADAFASSAEFQHTYGNLSHQEFVEQLYHNVLDRAGDTAGVAYWTWELATGQMDRGDVLLGFSESMEHQLNTAPVIVDHGIWFI